MYLVAKGYDLRMSRREIALNTLLGAALILTFAAFVVVGLGATLLAFNLVGVAEKHFLPGLARPGDATYYGIFCVWSLIAGTGHLRKRRWLNAFVSIAGGAMILSIFFARPDSALGPSGPLQILVILPILATPTDSCLTRFRFFSAVSLISAVVAVNTDLLGSGAFARIAADWVLVGTIGWFARDVLQRWIGPKNAGPQTPLSPTRA